MNDYSKPNYFKKGFIPWNKGKKMTQEYCDNIGRSRKGKPLSEEHKKKLSEAGKRRIFPEEVKQKISKSHLGVKLSPEHCKNIGLSKKGIIPTEETKKKLSESNQERLKNGTWKNQYGGFKGENRKAKQERNDSRYIYWSREIKNLDNWQCAICGCKMSKDNKLVSHHILTFRDYPDLIYDLNNGITLCRIHHPRKREDEERLIPYLQGLVEVRNNNLSGASKLANGEVAQRKSKGEAFKKDLYEEFSPETLANEGSKEDLKMDVKEGEK